MESNQRIRKSKLRVLPFDDTAIYEPHRSAARKGEFYGRLVSLQAMVPLLGVEPGLLIEVRRVFRTLQRDMPSTAWDILGMGTMGKNEKTGSSPESCLRDSNTRPAAYKAAALPTELRQHCARFPGHEVLYGVHMR